MTHICYIYIYSYRMLKNVGVSFAPHYTFRMEGNTLHINKDDSHPENFYGSGIYAVSLLVGNNGAGKTSILRFVMEAVVNGFHDGQGVDGVVVYENGGRLEVYQPQGKTYPSIHIDASVPFTKISRVKSIPVMYYSGHFAPFTDRGDILSSELEGSYIASDQWLLVHDLLSYSNYDAIYLAGRMDSFLSAYKAQNNSRICELLMLDGLDALLNDFRLPRYILIGINSGGAEFLANDQRTKIPVPRFVTISNDRKQHNISRFIYTNFINLIAEHTPDADKYIEILNAWQKTPKQCDVLQAFSLFIGENAFPADIQFRLQTLQKVLNTLFSMVHYQEERDLFYIEVRAEKEVLRKFVNELLNSHFFVTSKFFDIYYSHGLYFNTILSSGEQEMLNLLSRIYFATTLQPQSISNKNTPTLLLLDEAEIGFHPEWQRKYVNLLLQFLRTKTMVKPGVDFQLVITSHSPIILSDMPLKCVNILDKDDDGNTVVVENESETFGENVFNLYRRAFVMKDGLVGAFAADKIKALHKRIENGENGKDIVKEVMLVGDERVRNYLLSEIGKRDSDYLASYYQRQIEE